MVALILSSLPFFYLQLIASITPGPNNVMLTVSGMNFGYRRSVPHILGIMSGFLTLILLCSFGVGVVYHSFPQIEIVLRVLGSAYLVFLAYKISSAGRLGVRDAARDATKPMTFMQAFAFQFVNPKGIVFSITMIGILPAEISVIERSFVITLSTFITSAISTNTWAIFGKMIAVLFQDAKTRQIINVILALLLLATIPMMFLG